MKNLQVFDRKTSLNYDYHRKQVARINHENKKIAHSLLNKKATFDIVKVINEQTQKT